MQVPACGGAAARAVRRPAVLAVLASAAVLIAVLVAFALPAMGTTAQDVSHRDGTFLEGATTTAEQLDVQDATDASASDAAADAASESAEQAADGQDAGEAVSEDAAEPVDEGGQAGEPGDSESDGTQPSSGDSSSAAAADDDASSSAAAADASDSAESADKDGDSKSSESADADDESDDKDKDKDKDEADKRNTEKTFTAENSMVKVTATVAKPEKLPAGVKFKVASVSAESPQYNYDAYMGALNEGLEEPVYTDENTALFDVAFIDKAGAEVQPGKVTLAFEFKQNMLKTELDAKKGSDIQIVHMPLKQAALENAQTTAQATAITSDDVKTENVDGIIAITPAKEAATFNLNSLSIVAVGAPLKAQAGEEYTLRLYGYNFGGFYKIQSTTSKSASYRMKMIGYPDMLLDFGELKEKLTVSSFDALAEKPFTFAANGFDLEGDGFVPTEKNTYAYYMYDVIGFVPVKGDDIENLKNTDAYNNTYVFDTKEDAKSFVTSSAGVLYGEKPSADMLTALKEKGSVAMVWQRYNPAGFKDVYQSTNPKKIALGESKIITLSPGFNALQKGDYSETPLKVTLTLDDNLTFSAGWEPSIADDTYFAVDSSSVAVSEDRKSLSFNIIEIKQNYTSTKYFDIKDVQLDVADAQQTQDTVSLEVVNAWEESKTPKTTITITIDRPTIKTSLGGSKEKALFFDATDQAVQLKVEHGNATSGATTAHVAVTFPNLVTVKDAKENSSCKDTIENLTVTTADGVSIVKYDVKKYYARSNTATDLIDLVLDVKAKGDQDEEKGETSCAATVNDKDALVLQNASITVSDPYFDVLLYGPQDAWLDMSLGTYTHSTNRTLRFTGAGDYTALTKHKWSFDEDPIKGIYYKDPDGSVVVGPLVNNQYSNMQWKLVGFVPISDWSGTIRDRWNPLYGVYYLEDLQACKELIAEKNGVLYGETPTEEQAQSLAQYMSGTKAKVVCVWYIQEPPKEIYKKYSYDKVSIPEVHPAAYTATSEGIDVKIEAETYSSGIGAHPYNVTFTIPEGYKPPDDSGIITLNTEFNDASKTIIGGFQPGDKIEWNITVIDKTGSYYYVKDSGAVGTIDYYGAENMDYSVVGTGFEGYKIENSDEKPEGHSAKSRITRRGDSNAIRKLAEISGEKIATNPTDENVGKALYAIGYGAEWDAENEKPTGPLAKYAASDGEPDYAKITQELLDDYFLDYLNAVYFGLDDNKDADKETPHYTSFYDLSAADYRSIFNGDTGTQVMETNPELAAAMYYGMYEQTILMSETDEGIDSYKGTYSWMKNWNEKAEGNAYEDVIYNQYHDSEETLDGGSALTGQEAAGSGSGLTAQEATGSGGQTIIHKLHWYQWITGTRNGNNMQDTYYGLAYQFKLRSFGRLHIVKNVEDASANPEPATFVFHITGTSPLGEKYENYASVYYTGDGKAETYVTHIPTGTTVTVEEVYAGGRYGKVSGDGSTATIISDARWRAGDPVASVTFANSETDGPGGNGVQNNFELTKEGKGLDAVRQWVLKEVTPKSAQVSE